MKKGDVCHELPQCLAKRKHPVKVKIVMITGTHISGKQYGRPDAKRRATSLG